MTHPNIARVAALLLGFFVCACAPQSGPDKTVTGGLLGAALGAGSGAVIGNQLAGGAGPGAAVGAGFGLISGAITGGFTDLTESVELKHERELAILREQNNSNGQGLARLQARLDRATPPQLLQGTSTIKFDPDSSNLRAGAASQLEELAEIIKRSAGAKKLIIEGHTDDAGSTEYTEDLAESRARQVAAALSSRGISNDQIEIRSAGSKSPVASNATPEGRQVNNRVEVSVH